MIELALAAAATHALVQKALALPEHARFTERFLLDWGQSWGGAMLLLAVVAGVVVFRRATPWDVVLTWPWLVGVAVGVGYFFALSGQMDSGSKLCDLPRGDSCDTSWGLSAVMVSIAAGVLLGGAFVIPASLKRLLISRRRLGQPEYENVEP